MLLLKIEKLVLTTALCNNNVQQTNERSKVSVESENIEQLFDEVEEIIVICQ